MKTKSQLKRQKLKHSKKAETVKVYGNQEKEISSETKPVSYDYEKNIFLYKKKTKKDSTQINPEQSIFKQPINGLNSNTKLISGRRLSLMNNTNIRSHTQEKDNNTFRITRSSNKLLSNSFSNGYKNQYGLTKKESILFQDHFPRRFKKIKLLSRTQNSLIWEGQSCSSQKFYLIKQVIADDMDDYENEIKTGGFFFNLGGEQKKQFSPSIGIQHLAKLSFYYLEQKYFWIIYEKCGETLANKLYSLKQVKQGNQSIKKMDYGDLYKELRKDQNIIRQIILQVARAIQFLFENGFVHSNIKNENILINKKSDGKYEIKLIDYECSFEKDYMRQFSIATPQYMAPQLSKYLEDETYYQQIQFRYQVIDIWSLGSVILEIIYGIPLWLNETITVEKNSTKQSKHGLFAVPQQDLKKIRQEQLKVVKNLDSILEKQNYSGIVIDSDIKELLKKMLKIDPNHRISPSEIIDYFTNQTKK